ncbi:Tetratricopeptide repeat 28-like protein [Cladobotryum mycophilum]|uniref:Tetratricopeptide repeat 28-like protein n=1 Tax=Cladobotryum mycophilum TaxID=491253 RepID=A0ABR0SW16_9HYPO
MNILNVEIVTGRFPVADQLHNAARRFEHLMTLKAESLESFDVNGAQFFQDRLLEPVVSLAVQVKHSLRSPSPQLAEGTLGHFAYGGTTHRNLRNERVAADDHLRDLENGDDSLRARAFFECGKICLLQGETQTAWQHFRSAAAVSHAVSNTYFQVLCYGLHTIYMTYEWTADARTVPTDEMEPLYNLEKALPYWVNKVREVGQYVETASLHQLANLLEKQRSIVTTRGAFDQNQRSSSNIQLVEGMERNVSSSAAPFQLTAPLLLGISGLYHQLNHTAYAVALVDKQFQNYTKISDTVGMANCEVLLGDFECASRAPPESWGSVLRPGLDSTVSASIDGRDSTVTSAHLGRAVIHYLNAERFFKQADFPRGIATVRVRRGYLAILRPRTDSANTASHYEDAMRHFNVAEELFRVHGDVVAAHTAKAHSIMCQVGIGLPALSENMSSARAIGNWGRTKGSISYTFGLGLFFAAQARRWIYDGGDYERGLAACRLAEELLDGLGLEQSYIKSILDQVSVHEILGEYDRFIIAAERVLRACQASYEGPNSPLASWSKSRAAHVLQRMIQLGMKREDPDEVERAIERIQAIYPQRPQQQNLDRLVSMYNTMVASNSAAGLDMGAMGDITSDVTTQSTLRAAKFRVLVFRAQRAEQRGDEDAASEQWNLAEKMAQASEDTHGKELQLARIAAARRRYNDAAAHLNTYRELRLRATNAMGRHTASLAPDIRRLVGGQQEVIYETLLPGFAAIREFHRAEEMLRSLIKLRGEDWWKTGDEIENLTAAAEVKEGLCQFAAAWKFYEQAMQVYEQRRSQLSLDEYKLSIAGSSTIQGLYFKATRAAVAWHESLGQISRPPTSSSHLADAFQTLEKGKARSLLDLMAAGTMMYGQTEHSELGEWDEFRQVSAATATKRGLLRQQYSMKMPDQDRIRGLEVDIHMAEVKLSLLEERLFANKSPAAIRFVTTSDVTNIQSLRAQLDADTVILQYAYYNRDFVAWAIAVDGMVRAHHCSIRETELELRVRRFRDRCQSIGQPIQGEQPDPYDGPWLSDLLLHPFKTVMEKHHHIIIVAYRTLHALPFHVLPREGRPLIATHTVAYLPSASSLSYLQSDRSANIGRKVLSIGNPASMAHTDAGTGVRQPLRELRSAEAEALCVGNISKGSKSLVGREATRKAVMEIMSQFDVLHFATHGMPCAEVPMMSSIALADGKELTVSDLMGRRLSASLVVLSACDTASGQSTNGDDIIGFVRALLAAGVKSIVVSLWPVRDLATSFIMKVFYENLYKGKTASAALREAQMAAWKMSPEEMEMHAMDIRRAREDYSRAIQPEVNQETWKHWSQPRFWAPFIYIGIK